MKNDLRTLIVCGLCIVLNACGGGGGGGSSSQAPPPAATTYTVSGTISGLKSTVVLHLNGATEMPVSTNGPVTLMSSLATGASYAVSVKTQPISPTQECTVTSGSGTVSGNIGYVSIDCIDVPLTLSSSTRASSATDSARTGNIVLTFSTTLSSAPLPESSVTLMSAAGRTAVVASVARNQLIVAPSGQLLPITTYALTVTADIRGSGGEQLAAPVELSFTTRDGEWKEPQLVEKSAGAASFPQVAFDSSGNAVAVWNQLSGNRWAIWSNRYVIGAGWGSAALIEADDTSSALAPQVAVDAAGNALVVWNQSDLASPSTLANRYVVGSGWSTATRIETRPGYASHPQTDVNAYGDALAVWAQSDGTVYGIWANRYVVGAGWGTATLVEMDYAGDAHSPQIAVDSDGNALAVWQQYDGVRYNIMASRYVAGGSWGAAMLLEAVDFDAQFPQISIDRNGNAIAVWRQFEGSRHSIWANRYAAGSGWGAATPIESDEHKDALFPSVAIDPNGNALVVWEQWDQTDGYQTNIWANRYAQDGGWGEAQLIETIDAGDAKYPQVAFDSNGNALAVWYQYDGTQYNIWANRYVASHGWGVARLIEEDNAGDALYARIAIDSNGNALAIWNQSDGVSHSIWANRFE